MTQGGGKPFGLRRLAAAAGLGVFPDLSEHLGVRAAGAGERCSRLPAGKPLTVHGPRQEAGGERRPLAECPEAVSGGALKVAQHAGEVQRAGPPCSGAGSVLPSSALSTGSAGPTTHEDVEEAADGGAPVGGGALCGAGRGAETLTCGRLKARCITEELNFLRTVSLVMPSSRPITSHDAPMRFIRPITGGRSCSIRRCRRSRRSSGLRVRRRGVQGALQIAGRQASGSGAQAGKEAVQGLHLGVVADHHPILS